MPTTRTTFSHTWLAEKDDNGDDIGIWCKASSNQYKAFCTYCKTDFQIDNGGMSQIKAHAKRQKHRNVRSIVQSPGQSKLFSVPRTPSQDHQPSTSRQETSLAMSNHREDVAKAEIIWGLKVSESDYSYRSCDNIGSTFKAMFKCPIAEDFKLSRSKMSYMVSDGFGPYFTKQLIYDVNKSKRPYTLHYDETTTSQVKKQMDLHLRYWSEASGQVESKFYSSLMFGHAEGAKVGNCIIDQLSSDGAHINYLGSLGSDGPNVNKTIFDTIDARLKDSGSPGLLNIGTCNLHVVHNSIGKGLSGYSLNIDELAIDIHSFFKCSSARREDFEFYQLEDEVEEHVFLRHVSSRWLTLSNVIGRILEQWKPLVKYFTDLGKKESSAPKSNAFKRTIRKLQLKSTLPELLFVFHVFPPFRRFLEVFQAKEPLIHILFTEMCDLLIKFLSRFVTPDKFQAKKGSELTTVDVSKRENQLSDEQLVIGEETASAVKRLDHGDRKRFFLSVRQFYTTVGTYLIEHLPLKNEVLRDAACLVPSRKCEPTTRLEIQNLGRILPSIKDEDIARISDEWCLYQIEDADFRTQENDGMKEMRIDHYWSTVFQRKMPNGDKKYPVLEDVVKAILILPHGNADCERGFSKNKKMLGPDRNNLSTKSLIGKRLAKDAVVEWGQPENVPVTKDLMHHVRYSFQRYQCRLDEEKKEKENEQNRKREEKAEKERREQKAKRSAEEMKNLKEEGKKLEKQEKAQKDDLLAAENLLKEGSDKLCRALKAKDMVLASQAQLMIEKSQSSIETATKMLDSTREKQKNVEAKKRDNLEKSENRCVKRKKLGQNIM